MFRLTNNFRLLAMGKEIVSNNTTNYQTVRWRKPRWVPIAKSKLFKVPPRKTIPEEESMELKRLYNNYRTKIKSLRRYLTYKHCTRLQASEDPEEQHRVFQEDFDRCMAINNEWNLKRKEIRENRVSEQLKEELDFARRRLETELIKEEKKLEIIEDLVRGQKEAARSFILPENIDEAIEKAIESPVDYNFALTLEGEKIVGRENNGPEEQKLQAKQ